MLILIDYMVFDEFTSDDVDELGSIDVRGKVKAVGLDGASNDGDTGQLELRVTGVP